MRAVQLAGAIDATGRADLDAAVAALLEVARRYREMGVEPERNVTLIVEDMPIMGATESRTAGHRLHVGANAVASGMLDGLIAHEMGHMVRTEQGHPSHTAEVHRRVLRSLDVPPSQRNGFLAVARVAVNHVQDVYADDLAIRVIGRDRIAPFFSNWIENAARPGKGRWGTVGNEVTVAFALGNMARHHVSPEDGAADRAEAFARSAGLPRLNPMASSFRNLPSTDDGRTVEAAMRDLLREVRDEGLARSANGPPAPHEG